VYRRSSSGRKHIQKRRRKRIPAGLIFWTAFLILVAGLFFINRDKIAESLRKTQILEKQPSSAAERPESPAGGTPAGLNSAIREREESLPPPAAPLPPGTARSAPRPIEQRSAPPETPAADPAAAAVPVPAAPPIRGPEESAAEQILYFIYVNDEGAVLRGRTTRRIPLSGTPLRDTLEVLIAGPNAEEERQGMISLIPPETRVLNAVIEGNTARINFSEEFQYNTVGKEGFEAQLIQVVWTATEFPNVQDVQILIEGSRVDHLGEGIPIWRPLDRQSIDF
jgi:spore germination protein GerM